MRSRRRYVGVLAVLSRLRWQQDPQTWTVPCRDSEGHRSRVRVSLGEQGPQMAFEHSGVVIFAPLAAGRLRAALREAIDLHGRLSTCAVSPRCHPGPAPTPHALLEPASSERVQFQLSPDDDVRPPGRHSLRDGLPKDPGSPVPRMLKKAA